MGTLDRFLESYAIRTAHAIAVDAPAEVALQRVLSLPVASDWVVRVLFHIRRLAGADVPIGRFVTDVLGLSVVEQTETVFVVMGPLGSQTGAVLFEAVDLGDGRSRLMTETRVANVGIGFRLYWALIAPFSSVVRRRWLRAVAAG